MAIEGGGSLYAKATAMRLPRIQPIEQRHAACPAAEKLRCGAEATAEAEILMAYIVMA